MPKSNRLQTSKLQTNWHGIPLQLYCLKSLGSNLLAISVTMTALHAPYSGQVGPEELWEAGELEEQQDDLADGEGGADGRQDVRAAGVVRGAARVQERDPLETLRKKIEDVDVELIDVGAVDAEPEVDVGQDVRRHRHEDEDDGVGHVELVE